MATKRMFSSKIVGSDAFMDMPIGSQLLYFHLGMEADDDGFIGNPKRIMRGIGCKEDDLKVLISKNFVIIFETGVLVIKHNRMNNNWDTHNCKRTVYLEELSQLYIKENKSYTTDPTQGISAQTYFSLNPVLKQSLDKNRIEENRIEENRNTVEKIKEEFSYPEEFESFWKEYPEKIGKGKAYDSWKKLSTTQKEKCVVQIKLQVENKHFTNKRGEDYIPHPTTWLNQKRWEDEIKIYKQPDIIKFDKYGNIIK